MPSLGHKQKKSKEVFCISCAHNFDQEENKACNKNEHRVNKVAKAKTAAEETREHPAIGGYRISLVALHRSAERS